MSIQKLFARVAKEHRVKPAPRDAEAKLKKLEKKLGRALPRDLREFHRRFAWAALHDEQFRILPLSQMKPAGVAVAGAAGKKLCPASWWSIAENDNSEVVAIDLETGRIIDCFHETFGPGGDAGIIARSFQEFLKRMLPSKKENGHYWLKRSFKRYGNAFMSESIDHSKLRPRNAALIGELSRSGAAWQLDLQFQPIRHAGKRVTPSVVVALKKARSWRELGEKTFHGQAQYVTKNEHGEFRDAAGAKRASVSIRCPKPRRWRLDVRIQGQGKRPVRHRIDIDARHRIAVFVGPDVADPGFHDLKQAKARLARLVELEDFRALRLPPYGVYTLRPDL
jgi:hypothetical protein